MRSVMFYVLPLDLAMFLRLTSLWQLSSSPNRIAMEFHSLFDRHPRVTWFVYVTEQDKQGTNHACILLVSLKCSLIKRKQCMMLLLVFFCFCLNCRSSCSKSFENDRLIEEIAYLNVQSFRLFLSAKNTSTILMLSSESLQYAIAK